VGVLENGGANFFLGHQFTQYENFNMQTAGLFSVCYPFVSQKGSSRPFLTGLGHHFQASGFTLCTQNETTDRLGFGQLS